MGLKKWALTVSCVACQVSELTRRIKEQTQLISSMRKRCTELGAGAPS